MQRNRNSHTTSTKCQYQAANLEAEMLLGREVSGIGAQQADQQEDRADQHVEAVEAGRHEEGGAIDVAGEAERGVAVFVGLHAGERSAEQDSDDQRLPDRPRESSSSNAWCAHVTVVPEVSKISVFSSGRCQGSKVSMPFGGQTPLRTARFSRVACSRHRPGTAPN